MLDLSEAREPLSPYKTVDGAWGAPRENGELAWRVPAPTWGLCWFGVLSREVAVGPAAVKLLALCPVLAALGLLRRFPKRRGGVEGLLACSQVMRLIIVLRSNGAGRRAILQAVAKQDSRILNSRRRDTSVRQ